MILSVCLDVGQRSEVLEVPVTPQTRAQDVVTCCAEPGETYCHLAAVIGQTEHPLKPDQSINEVIQSSTNLGQEVSFFLRHYLPDHAHPSPDLNMNRQYMDNSQLEGLSMEQMAKISTNQRQLAERTAELARVEGAARGHTERAGEGMNRLKVMKERVDIQEARLERLRRNGIGRKKQTQLNTQLDEELSALRSLFNEKESELSLAVARVEQLSQQLGDLKVKVVSKRGYDLQGSAARGHRDRLDVLRQELKASRSSQRAHSALLSRTAHQSAERQAHLTLLQRNVDEVKARVMGSRGQNVRVMRPLTSVSHQPRAPNVAAVEPYVHRPLTPSQSPAAYSDRVKPDDLRLQQQRQRQHQPNPDYNQPQTSPWYPDQTDGSSPSIYHPTKPSLSPSHITPLRTPPSSAALPPYTAPGAVISAPRPQEGPKLSAPPLPPRSGGSRPSPAPSPSFQGPVRNLPPPISSAPAPKSYPPKPAAPPKPSLPTGGVHRAQAPPLSVTSPDTAASSDQSQPSPDKLMSLSVSQRRALFMKPSNSAPVKPTVTPTSSARSTPSPIGSSAHSTPSPIGSPGPFGLPSSTSAPKPSSPIGPASNIQNRPMSPLAQVPSSPGLSGPPKGTQMSPMSPLANASGTNGGSLKSMSPLVTDPANQRTGSAGRPPPVTADPLPSRLPFNVKAVLPPKPYQPVGLYQPVPQQQGSQRPQTDGSPVLGRHPQYASKQAISSLYLGGANPQTIGKYQQGVAKSMSQSFSARQEKAAAAAQSKINDSTPPSDQVKDDRVKDARVAAGSPDLSDLPPARGERKLLTVLSTSPTAMSYHSSNSLDSGSQGNGGVGDRRGSERESVTSDVKDGGESPEVWDLMDDDSESDGESYVVNKSPRKKRGVFPSSNSTPSSAATNNAPSSAAANSAPSSAAGNTAPSSAAEDTEGPKPEIVSNSSAEFHPTRPLIDQLKESLSIEPEPVIPQPQRPADAADSSNFLMHSPKMEVVEDPSFSLPGREDRAQRKILKKGSRLGKKHNRGVTFDPLSLLLDASLEGELRLVKQTAQQVDDPSVANDEGITALHNAICAGHYDIVVFLVEFGCNVNAQDSDGWTPLHCAASCNNLPMTQCLVDHGAAILAVTLSDQETAAEKCEETEEGFDGCSQYLYGVEKSLGIANDGVVYALWDYQSENSEDELSLKANQRLVVLRRGDSVERDWWWVREAPEEEEALKGSKDEAPQGSNKTENGDGPKKMKEGYVAKNLLSLTLRVTRMKDGKPVASY